MDKKNHYHQDMLSVEEARKKILDNFRDELVDLAMVESTSRPDGRSLTMVLAPSGGKK